MKLNELKPARGARKKRKRLGCGTGSGRGTTCGKGTKGQLSRSGGGMAPWFEGGQMPLQRRLPARGFTNPNRKSYQVVNVADLARFEAGAAVGAEELYAARLIRKKNQPVKLLGQGEIAQALTIRVHAASKSAVEKIKQGGGTIELLARPAKETDQKGAAKSKKAPKPKPEPEPKPKSEPEAETPPKPEASAAPEAADEEPAAD